MTTSRAYKRGLEFPNEGFVQLSIEAHFRSAGYVVVADGQVDLLCTCPSTGEHWQIEAKGHTTQVGLDFRTGLGQLVQGMRSERSRYGIAVPDTPAFRAQVSKLQPWVVSLLGIHWLLVSPDGSVEIIAPDRRS